MPELPEVEHLRRSLEPHLLGRHVRSAALRRRDVCDSFEFRGSSARRVRTSPAHLLEGAAITHLLRHGKQLAIVADSGAVLVVQLGMSGRLTIADPSEPLPKHTHATWSLEQPSTDRVRGRAGSTNRAPLVAPSSPRLLLFTDPRRFGGLTTYPSLELLHQHRWAALGPDALTITDTELTQRLAQTNRAIKAALLDQEILAGVGNIYADEALFEARIAPTTIARTIPAAPVSALAAAFRLVLGRAVAAGGSTLRNYVDASGQPGTAQAGHQVYGRAAQPCLRCGSPLRSGVIAQRTTVWCSQCQGNPPRDKR